MISHLFYHQERVEETCAINSWKSIRNNFCEQDEVVILDLGNTLKNNLEFTIVPKYTRIEKIRTDKPNERSYTYGLNNIIPTLKSEWICIWRSDYIYHSKYFTSFLKRPSNCNIVLPYEAFIGADYCDGNWCEMNLTKLTEGDELFILENSQLCPVYELMDFPHFMIKKNLWINSNGMNEKLYGYGYQFPELFYRLKQKKDYKPYYSRKMVAFHQNHEGSFSLNNLDDQKLIELAEVEKKLLNVFQTNEAIAMFKQSLKQIPLWPRSPRKYYLNLKARNIINHIYLNVQDNNKKIAIFGTGKLCENIYPFFEGKISYFIDNDPGKWGNEFFQIKILNPNTLFEEDKTEIVIIVASSFYNEISLQLRKLGFQQNINFFDGSIFYLPYL